MTERDTGRQEVTNSSNRENINIRYFIEYTVMFSLYIFLFMTFSDIPRHPASCVPCEFQEPLQLIDMDPGPSAVTVNDQISVTDPPPHGSLGDLQSSRNLANGEKFGVG